MFTQFLPEREPSPKEISQPRVAYAMAYKTCVFSSALLCKKIGITLNTKNKWGIELEGPRPVPVIFVILALCCAYRMVLGWSQCGIEKDKLATFDYNIARLFAFGAILISVGQYLTQIQVVDSWSERFYSPEQCATLEQVLFLGIAVFVHASITGIREWKDFGWLKRIITVFSIPISLYLGLYLLSEAAGSRGYLMALAALIIGAFLALFSRFLLSRMRNTAPDNGAALGTLSRNSRAAI